MELQNLSVSKREGKGKGPAHQTRVKGLIPAVVYGGGQDPLPITVNTKVFDKLLQGRFGEHAVVQLEVDGAPDLNSPALLKQVQRHPLKEYVLHADFLRIRLDERIETVVPIELTGQPAGVVEGGVLEHQLRELEVECLALEVPEHILVDVSHLNIGDSVHVSDLIVPEGITVLTDPERPVALITIPRAIVEAAPSEAAAEGAEGAAEGEEKKEGEADKKKEGEADKKKDDKSEKKK